MITDTIISWGAAFVSWMFGLFPSWSLPSFITAIPDGAATVGGYIGDFSPWLPIPVVLGVLTFLVISFGVAVSVKVVRWIQSSLTGGGGVT